MKKFLFPALLVLLGCALGALGCLLLSDMTPTVPIEQMEALEKTYRTRIGALEKDLQHARALRSTVDVSITNAVERRDRKYIRKLESELAAARAALAAVSTNAPAEGEVKPLPAQTEFRPPNPREWMENLKKNDPKKYEEMRQHWAQRRQQRLQRTQGRLDYLSSIDTSRMSKNERANHEKLQDLLAQRENLPELDPTEATEEEMRAARDARHQLEQEIRQANKTERETLLRQTAEALGLEGEDAQTLTDAIKEVIDVTGGDRGGPHDGPPGGPQGGTPPPPPQGN